MWHFSYFQVTKEAEKTDKDEKRPESSAMRTRRMRRERRSTGIANYTAEVITLVQSLGIMYTV